MARRSRPSFTKRQKEMARQQKQADKSARRLESKQSKGSKPEVTGGEDPEIAGIRPGPQPAPAWMEAPQRRS
jgi:hypothetical protein